MSASPFDAAVPPVSPVPPDFLRGGGQMGALIRAHDWSNTALGPPERWSAALRTVMYLVLNSAQPMYIFWGPELLCFYNDAFRQSIGPERHPGSLGQPGRDVWEEIWDIIGPQINQVMEGRGGTSHQNAPVPITRNGRVDKVYWTYSYNPVFDLDASRHIGGVLMICTETTEQVVLAERAATERRQLAELFEQAPTFMAILRGPEHRVEFANPAFLQLVGKRPLLGRTIAQALPDAAAQGYVEILDTVYRSGQPYAAKGARYTVQATPAIPADERYVDFVYQPIKSTAGTVNGIFVAGADVTGRAVSEAALQRSEEQLRLATEAAEVALWDWDVITDTLYWAPRVKAMFGMFTDAPATMADFYEGLHPEDRDPVIAAFRAALDPSRRALYDVEYRTLGKEDRVERWVAAKGRGIFADDRCVRVIGTAMDITASKATKAELRELNERLEQRVADAIAEKQVFVDIIEATDARVQVVDRNFRIMAINRATADDVERLYGVRPKAGDDLRDLRPDLSEQREIVSNMWSRALAGEEFTVFYELGDPARALRHYEMKFNSLRNAAGELVGAFHFVYDVTDRLRDQARLAESELQLRQAQKIEALGRLTGGVAHDFNNLLMVIKGGLSLLKRPNLESERRQSLLTRVEQAADRGAALSRQLLAFARRQPLKAESVDLRRQIDGMRELLDRTLRGDVQVRTEWADDLWPIEVDPAELEFVILNLCVNARDAMPSGGVITISAHNVRDLHQANLSGDFVRLSIADPGTGMSADVLTRVFEPFYTTKEIGQGSGLGLPQVHGFAEQSGGSVSIDSTLGRGTTVTLLLRRAWAPPSAPAPSSDLASTATRRAVAGSILLVEDDDEVAALVTEMLRELGYQVTRTANARGALGALADDRPIDLVLSDVMMPGEMNGIDLVREVRRRRPGLPVLLTTGYANKTLLSKATDHFSVLHKPYEVEALESALREALSADQ